MPTADSITSANKKLSFLFKGPSGFGKTLAAASFAEEGPVYLGYIDKKEPIELEKFFKTVLKRPELLKRIEYDVYGPNNIGNLFRKLKGFTQHCDKFAVIVDSLTTLTASIVNWNIDFRVAKLKTPPEGGVAIPEMPDYKMETSFLTQLLGFNQDINAHVIYTAHPLPQLKVEDGAGPTGQGLKFTKSNSLVTYGSRIAGMIPGQFTEIYHFWQQSIWNGSKGMSELQYMINTEPVGEEFAKTALNLPKNFNITGKSFYEMWKESLK